MEPKDEGNKPNPLPPPTHIFLPCAQKSKDLRIQSLWKSALKMGQGREGQRLHQWNQGQPTKITVEGWDPIHHGGGEGILCTSSSWDHKTGFQKETMKLIGHADSQYLDNFVLISWHECISFYKPQRSGYLIGRMEKKSWERNSGEFLPIQTNHSLAKVTVTLEGDHVRVLA